MNWLKRFQRQEKLQVIGLMSGTSADGLDLARVEIEPSIPRPKIQMLDFVSFPYSDEIQKHIFLVAAPNGASVEKVCRLNFILGHLFADRVLNYLDGHNIAPKEIACIGSHGQTICHLPEKVSSHGITTGATLQIGDPAIIAARTGIVTVGDFRIADMALGGEGAPLIPLFDYYYFHHPGSNRVILNIGGIANITYLPRDCRMDAILAFDTGPGNVLLDTICREYFRVPFDREGRLARGGKIRENLLLFLLEDEYYLRPPPKSTGREKFTGAYLSRARNFLGKQKISGRDWLATATELTARTIHEACLRFLPNAHELDELIVSGGGAQNRLLMQRLKNHFHQVDIRRSDEMGLPSEAKEAVCFAVLAYHTLVARPANLPSVTGASRKTILGKICLP